MLPILSKLISEVYTPKPKEHHLNEMYDFKCFCVDGDGAQCNIIFNHDFLITRSSLSHNTVLYAKQYSSSSQWEPQEGCRLLLQFPNTQIHDSEQMAYDDHKKLAPSSSFDKDHA